MTSAPGSGFGAAFLARAAVSVRCSLGTATLPQRAAKEFEKGIFPTVEQAFAALLLTSDPASREIADLRTGYSGQWGIERTREQQR